MKKVVLYVLLFLVIPLHALVQLVKQEDALHLTTLYGTTIITEPILITLINHPAFQRLKDIHQYGVYRYAYKDDPEYTRYQHSLGVFFLVRKYGASLEEQIVALLHDVSHTVFSHVGDVLFNSNYRTSNASYQDEIHEWYLRCVGIEKILQEYGYEGITDNTTKDKYRCFDQPRPGLGADRIEYNITGGFIDGLISADEIQALIKVLRFVDGIWFFENEKQAKRFGLISLHLTEHRWGSARGAFLDYNAACALKRAYVLSLINKDDILFSTDDVIWQLLCNSTDEIIQKHIYAIKHCDACCKPVSIVKTPLSLMGKFSGTDPLVNNNGTMCTLSSLDNSYRQEFERVKTLVLNGWHYDY